MKPINDTLTKYIDKLRDALIYRYRGDEEGEDAITSELDDLWYQLTASEKDAAANDAKQLADRYLDLGGNVIADPSVRPAKRYFIRSTIYHEPIVTVDIPMDRRGFTRSGASQVEFFRCEAA